MIKGSRNIHNVDVFSVIDGDVLNTSINKECRINHQQIPHLKEERYTLHHKHYFIHNSKDFFKIYSYKTSQIETHNIHHDQVYNIINDSDFVINLGQWGQKIKTLCRWVNGKISWRFEYSEGYLTYNSNEFMIFCRKGDDVFEVVELNKGKVIWTWDISVKHSYRAVGKVRKGHLRGDVLLWEDRFIMPVAGPIGGPSPMYALDKDTGEELWCIDRPESPDNVIYNDRIVATGRNAIREYDLLTGELIRNEPIDLSSIDRGLVSRGLISDDKIFYYSSKGYNLVIIDYNTLEVLDTYHLEKTSPES